MKRVLEGVLASMLVLSFMVPTAPIVPDRGQLHPVKAKNEHTKAIKCSETHENGSNFDFSAFVEYLTAEFENAAERAINGRGSYADTGSQDGDPVVEPIPEGTYQPDEAVEQEPTGDNLLVEDDQQDSELCTLIYLGDYTITFYCQCEQCCGRWAWSNSTASGAVPYAGWTVAAGESLSFGTMIYIEGFGEYCVEDRGVPDGWIDIYVNDHSEIPSYGMTSASVYLEG